MRVLVTGGRNFADRRAVFLALDQLLDRCPSRDSLRVIQGGASGADHEARIWCCARLVSYENYPAKWGEHGRAAGPIRNQQMLTEGKPDLVVAFPGGRGTADMVRRAKAAGVKVVEVDDGSAGNEGGAA